MEKKGSKKKKQLKNNDTQLSFDDYVKSETEIKILPAKKTTSVTLIFPGTELKKVD